MISAAGAAAVATARAAVGRSAVASGPDDAMGNGQDEWTGKEAKGFLRLQGRDFKPESRCAHVVRFRPPPVTILVVRTLRR